jgi:hypothetical protein
MRRELDKVVGGEWSHGVAVAEQAVLYPEGVADHSPGLPRFAATLGGDCGGRMPLQRGIDQEHAVQAAFERDARRGGQRRLTPGSPALAWAGPIRWSACWRRSHPSSARAAPPGPDSGRSRLPPRASARRLRGPQRRYERDRESPCRHCLLDGKEIQDRALTQACLELPDLAEMAHVGCAFALGGRIHGNAGGSRVSGVRHPGCHGPSLSSLRRV